MSFTDPVIKWKLKACPRCKGDLHNADTEFQCIQCGYIEHTGQALDNIEAQIYGTGIKMTNPNKRRISKLDVEL